MSKLELKKSLATIDYVFNTKKVLNRSTDLGQIRKYYWINRIPYSVVASREGFVHMGLSKDGTLKPQNYSVMPETIAGYIDETEAKKVLELAPGKGANLLYLASRYPDTKFLGIDLPGAQTDFKKLNSNKNISVSKGDYHDLSRYKSNSIDVAFIIEGICYSNQQPRLFKELKRILKSGGYFIIYDGYNGKPYEDMDASEEKATRLAWLGMMVSPYNMLPSKQKADLEQAGFHVVAFEDITEQILPSVRHFRNVAKKFLDHRRVAKLLVKIFPPSFSGNIISGYLMQYLFENGLAKYYRVVAVKK